VLKPNSKHIEVLTNIKRMNLKGKVHNKDHHFSMKNVMRLLMYQTKPK